MNVFVMCPGCRQFLRAVPTSHGHYFARCMTFEDHAEECEGGREVLRWVAGLRAQEVMA